MTKNYPLLGLLLLASCGNHPMNNAGKAIQPQQSQHPAALGEIIITPLPKDEAEAFLNKIERAKLYSDDTPSEI